MYPIGYFSPIIMALFTFDSLTDFLASNVWLIVSTVLLGVIAIIIADVLLTYWKKPKFVIECSNIKQGKLGFSVYIRKKEVDEATVKCNELKYEWETRDGKKCEKVDFRINDDPFYFYPFDVTAEFVEGISNIRFWSTVSHRILEYSGGVQLTITEPETQRIVYKVGYAIPLHSKSLVVFSPWNVKNVFPVRIRIVGKGLEEERDYVLHIGLRNLTIHPIINGKPIMEYLLWAFEVKTASKILSREREQTFIY